MATQSTIAESGAIVRATEIDNTQKLFDSSSIVYNQINSNTYGQITPLAAGNPTITSTPIQACGITSRILATRSL